MSPTAPWRISRTLVAAFLLATPALSTPGAEVAFSAPVAAAPAASDEARLVEPPARLEIPAGQTKGSAMGSAAPGRPAEFLFDAPAAAMLSIGASSKSGEARLSLYPEGKEQALSGTAPSDGAIRWIGSPGAGTLRIVVHTQGAETPVRVEVSVERDAAE